MNVNTSTILQAFSCVGVFILFLWTCRDYMLMKTIQKEFLTRDFTMAVRSLLFCFISSLIPFFYDGFLQGTILILIGSASLVLLIIYERTDNSIWQRGRFHKWLFFFGLFFQAFILYYLPTISWAIPLVFSAEVYHRHRSNWQQEIMSNFIDLFAIREKMLSITSREGWSSSKVEVRERPLQE